MHWTDNEWNADMNSYSCALYKTVACVNLNTLLCACAAWNVSLCQFASNFRRVTGPIVRSPKGHIDVSIATELFQKNCIAVFASGCSWTPKQRKRNNIRGCTWRIKKKKEPSHHQRDSEPERERERERQQRLRILWLALCRALNNKLNSYQQHAYHFGKLTLKTNRLVYMLHVDL